MTTKYTIRCEILAKWLEIRNDVINIRNAYERMSSTHTAYTSFQEMIEEKRDTLASMQRNNPWLNGVLDAIGEGA